MAELQSRNQLVKQLQSNIDRRVQVKDDRRERSQQAIYSTLHNLEIKLLKFTQNSKKNHGGLKEIIGDGTLQSERMTANQSAVDPQRSPQFKLSTSRNSKKLLSAKSRVQPGDSPSNESLITIDEFREQAEVPASKHLSVRKSQQSFPSEVQIVPRVAARATLVGEEDLTSLDEPDVSYNMQDVSLV